MEKNTKFTLVLDSSQITTFLDCPTLWKNKYRDRLYPTTYSPDVEAMNAGTYGHKLLDIYYTARSLGTGINDAIEQCFAYDPDKDMCECGCAHHHHKDILGLQECHRCHKCLRWRPHPLALSQETRFLVRTRFREYVFKWQANDYVPISANHVEVGFSDKIFEDDENLFVLEGRIDMIAELQGVRAIVDHKFQLSTHWLYPKSIQFKNYALVAKVNMLIINYIRLHKKLSDATMVRELISFSAPELGAWRLRLIQIFFAIKACMQADFFPQVWSSCSGYGKTYSKEKPNYCWFGPLCEEWDDRMKEAKKQTLFKVQEVAWRPW